MSLYIETTIRGSMEELWQKTQNPALHQQWDLRFSDIHYLPRPNADAPQRFNYQTRIGFGLAIRGTGETLAIREGANGKRTSALKFWSDAPASLIQEGAGYWQYVPTRNGVRFLTRYDYRTRFGAWGNALDKALFRPLMAWATAWSFDQLRLWVERGQSPRQTLLYLAGMILLWATLIGVWAAWLLAPDRAQLIGLLLFSTAGFTLHYYALPHLPSAARCRWTWK